jgi:hypothetical protein
VIFNEENQNLSSHRPNPVAIESEGFHEGLQLSQAHQAQKDYPKTYPSEEYGKLLELTEQNPSFSGNELPRRSLAFAPPCGSRPSGSSPGDNLKGEMPKLQR